jgi:hypothetical protein
MDMPETLLAVRRLSAGWPEVSLKLVEDKANGPPVIQSLRHEISGFVEVNPERGKVSRAAAATAVIAKKHPYYSIGEPVGIAWRRRCKGVCESFSAWVSRRGVWKRSANARRAARSTPNVDHLGI